MTTDTSRPRLKLSTPADVAASVPYLLGFEPHSSIVTVFFAAADTHELVLTARADLTVERAEFLSDSVAAEVSHTCRVAREAGAGFGQVIIYPPPSADPFRLSDALRVAVEGAIGGCCVGHVSKGEFVDHCGDPTPVELSSRVQAVSELVGHGMSYLPSRDALRDQIAGPPDQRSGAILEFCEDPNYEPVSLMTARGRKKTEDEIYAFVSRAQPLGGSSEPAMPSVESHARWLVALHDQRVREPILWRMALLPRGGRRKGPSGRSPYVLDQWCLLVRSAPMELAAPAAAALAAYAWQVGQGALAGIAAEYAIKCDPTNCLATLVFEAQAKGVPPSMWVDMLASMTLTELRSGSNHARVAANRSANLRRSSRSGAA